MTTFAIGDLQGCFRSFQILLEQVGFNASRDRLWLVGDLVNRGDQSLETLRFVRDLGERAITVLGNHDLHLVMRGEGFGRVNAEDTLDAVLDAPDRDELLAWLRAQPLFHVEGDYAMVHAGLLPQWSILQARELAGEVESALQADDYRDFLGNMWGSKPDEWNEHLRGWDRLRVIVNAMTRMRFCTPEGRMDFRAKGGVDSAPPGYLPWFAVPARASLTHTVICGHWSALGFRREEKLLALDSGCLWGGHLTAVRLDDRKVVQIPCPRLKQPDGA